MDFYAATSKRWIQSSMVLVATVTCLNAANAQNQGK
jgi:IS5 family transposase